MATLRERREGKKETGTNGVLSLREWSKRNGSQTRSAPVPAKVQPTIEDEPTFEGRHRPDTNEWTREEAAAAAAEVQANDERAAEERFGGMTTDELLSYVPADGRDRNLYNTYMRGRLSVAESLERQSRQAKSAAASAGNDAEAYREFLGMPGASDEDIFGLAQAIRANNAQAKSLEPQKWLEYAEGLKESEEKKQSLADQGRELKRRADAASEQGQAWEYSNVIKSYGELINSPDFAKKSQYVAPKESADDIWKKDKNDPRLRYMAINGDSHAQVGLQQEAWSTGDRGGVGNVFDLGGDNDYLFELTDMEKGVYNALYASSPEAADDFVEKLKPYLEVRARDTYAKRMAQIARESPVGASIASVGMNLAQSGEYVLQLAELIGKGKINQNSAAYRASQMSNAVRGEVSKMAEEKWGKVGSAAYNLGMSMADFLTTTAVGGGTKALSLALMGTRAASNTVLNLKDRGLDDTAAFTLGSIAGAAEIVTESFSLEKLLNPNIVADGIAKNILKNFLTEASEEGAADVLNWAAEYIYDAITGNNEAEWKQKVYDAIQNGADPNDAVLAAIQSNLVQLGTDMLSGGISGGLMSAAGTPFYLNNFSASEQGQYANAIRGNEEGLQALIQSGLESPQNTESYQRAQAALKQFADGKTPSTLTIARLVEANQQQIENEAAEQSGQGRFRLTLPRTTAQEAPQTPQETRNTPGLTLPVRTTQTAESAAETPRLTLPARTVETEDGTAETPRLTLPTAPGAEQIAAFEDEQGTAERAAQAESKLVTRLRASKPGLLMDDYASGIDETQRRAIDETAKRLGLRVGFSDTVSVGQDNAKIYDDGVVLIEKNNPNPIGFLYGHEMGHWLQQNSPEAYSEFAEAARATDPEWFKAREEATAAAYRDAGIEISAERLQEEVLSDYAGWLVQDEDVLNRFINQNKDKPNVLRRLYEAIKALAAKLTGKEKQQATTAADLLLRAMNATEANVQNGIMSTGETRSQLKSPGDNGYNGDSGGEYNGQSYEGTMGEAGENGRTIGGNDRGRMARVPQNQGGGSTESWSALSESKQRAIGYTAERYLNSIDSDTRSLLDRIGNPHTIAKTIWERYQENPASADWWADFIPDVYDFLNEVSDIVSSPEGNEAVGNTADSEGSELSTGQATYFEGSKIRDKQGRLLVLYHGTAADFTTFDLSRSGQNYSGWSEFGEGIYLTPNAKLAQFAADEGGRGRQTRIMPLYANLESPFNTMDPVPFAIADLAGKYNLTEYDQKFLTGAGYRLLDFMNEHHESIREYLVGHGYDGVWDSYNGRMPSQVVAYYENQVKDISNANPTDDPDTMRSLKGLNADIAPESIQKYGQIPKGEKPARDINVPRKVTDKEDERVSWTARTALEAKATPDAAIPAIAELVEKGAFSYRKKRDKAAIADAEATIRDKGWSSSYADWVKDVIAGKVSKANTAMGWALYNNAANAGDLDTALNVLDLMVRHQRNAAQALQASRILKQLSPEAQLYGVQRSVDNLVKELQERYGKKKNIDIQINRDLAQAFLDAKTEGERQKALEALYKDIGRQVPATFRDKWNAWRYLAMLANPRTHLRNITGNLGFAPVVFAKDQVATVLEGIASAVSKGKVERTKGLVLPVRDHDLVKAAWDRYQSVRDEALGGGKYNDSQMANRWIEEGRTIFKFKPLELARRGNSAALDAEDAWFSQPHYTYALAQYCKANGITPAQIRSGEGMGEADAYAIKEAQKATYRDINAFSDFVRSIGRTADRKTGVGKAASAVLEGVLPFRGTPANILVRGLEYSPIGLLKSLTYDISQVMRKGEDGNPRMSVSEMLDDVSEGLTGTGILLLGGLLAKLGLLRGHGEDEKKERDYYDLMGFQNYALTLPNGESYTLDWLAPESLPLFVGVNIYEKLQQSKGDMNMSDLIDVVSQISEPMLEMSMLQSLNDMFESIGYAKENELSGLTQILSSAATSYLTQAIPTLLGQGERTGENLRMTTYTDKNKWLTKSMQYTLGKISAKVPGWDYGQVPYIDAWGRTEETGEGWVDRALKNMVNPAYTDKIRMSDMEKELLRLYELNPEDNGSVLATSHKASKYLTHNNERIDLTAEQYVDYATTKGQTAYNLMTDLVKTEEYKNASDEDKIKMVDSVYDYAATIAKGELLESLGNTYDDYEKLKTKLDKGADILDMIALTQEIKAADEAGNANSSYDTLEKLTAVEALGLPEAKAEPLLEQQLSEGQWAKYSTLKDAGVNYDTRLDIMRKYAELDSNEEMKPGEKALEFSHYVDSLKLTSKQTQLVKDTYKFWSMVPAEAKRYEAFKQAGLSEDKSKHTAEVLGALKPLPGKEDVTDLQRYRAIESDKTLTNAEKIKVIGSIMGTAMKTETGNPSQWAKFNTALNNGQTLSQAIDLCANGRLDEFMKWTESAAKVQNVKWDVYDTFLKQTAELKGDKDANGKTISGSLKKKVVAYIDSLNLTPEQKDALLTDYNSTYKHDVTWHNGSYGSSSGSGRTYARANLSRLELPRTNARQTGRLTLPTR